MTAIACYRCKKRGEGNRRELAAVATGIDLRFCRHVFRKSAGASHCRSFCPPLHIHCIPFCGKGAHVANICLIAASAPAKKSVTRAKIVGIGLSMEAENRNGHYAPAERRNQHHEILNLAPTASRRSTPLRNSARVCTHQQCIVAPYGRCAGDL